MQLGPGTRLGSYEILGPIGAGGMGEVYRARDTKLHREVAVKVLPPAFAQDRDRLARFEREAQSLAALNHPHIAQIYGVLEAPPALVMELVDGEDLSARLARGAMPLEEALPLAIQIAEALECAHERGIIHRDLKPANIKLAESGSVKVLDFGLAKAMAADPSGVAQGLENSPTFTSPAMTQFGVILGTAAYMAPEQAKGKAVDRRADAWAFGAVLFEMLTAQRAFAGEDVTDVIASIMRAEPEWTALPSDTPASLRKLLKRCLEKDRAKRLDSMAVAHYEMQEALTAPEPRAAVAAAAPARPFWRRALPFAITALAAAALGAIPAWVSRPVPAAPVVRFVIPLAQGQSVATAGRLQMAVSPDGRRMAYIANRELFVRALDSLEPTRVYANDAKLGIGSLAFSPDGNTLAFSVGSSIMRVPATGGTAVTVTEADGVFGMRWSGDSLIYTGDHAILRVPAAGGTPETLVTLARDEFGLRPQLLPDGRTLLFTLAKGEDVIDRWDDASIVTQRIGEQSRTTLVTRASEGYYAPTGHLLYAQSGVLYAAALDAAAPRLRGDAVPVLEGVGRGAGLYFGGTAHFVVSDSGALLYLPGPKVASSRARSALVLADGATSIETLKLPPGAYSEPRVSPDNRFVAFSVEEGKQSNIWIHDLRVGGSARRLTFGGAERSPVWTADSTRLAYQAQRDGVDAIYWQRADGSDVPVPLTKPEPGTSHIPHAWTKDGTLFLDARRGATYTLMTVKAAGGTLQPFGGVVANTLTAPTISPDGRWVSYTTRTPGSQAAVFVQPFPATGAIYQVSKPSEDGHHSTWSRDGQTLFYTPGPGPLLVAVPVMTTTPFTMGEPRVLNRQFSNQPSQIARPYDVMADGRFLGVGSPNGTSAVDGTLLHVVLNWFDELRARVPAK